MINMNKKSNKGITLIATVVTVVLLSILFGSIVYNVSSPNGVGIYNSMKSDIGLLEDKIIIYYNKYNKVPTTDRNINIDGKDYYEIDLAQLDDITLNYGFEYGGEGDLTEDSDIYVVNNSLHVYYLKGVKVSEKIYHEINR